MNRPAEIQIVMYQLINRWRFNYRLMINLTIWTQVELPMRTLSKGKKLSLMVWSMHHLRRHPLPSKKNLLLLLKNPSSLVARRQKQSRRLSLQRISRSTNVSRLRTRLNYLGASSYQVHLTLATWASAIQLRMGLLTPTLASCLVMVYHTRKRAIITPGFTSVWREHRTDRHWLSIYGAWPHRVSYTKWDFGQSIESAPTQWSGSDARAPCLGTMKETSR